LPRRCPIEALATALHEAGALQDEKAPLVLVLPRTAAIDCSALTFLCAWGRLQARNGRRLLFTGDRTAIRRLQQLDLHEHLGLGYSKPPKAIGIQTFVPLRLLSTPDDMRPAAQGMYELVQRHFTQASAFLPALRWAVGEILDNVFTHADATEAGAVFCEFTPTAYRLDVSICDLGRGIFATLGEHLPLYSHGHAITTALRRGVTRSEDIAQGNGLAGVVEIVKRNGGSLRVWSGNAVVRIAEGVDKGFSEMSELPGTGVAFSLDSRRPVDLGDTWIAAVSGDHVLQTRAPSGRSRIFDVARESGDTSSRATARVLRSKVSDSLQSEPEPLTLDFSGVSSATSSYLDELLGRLAEQLGENLFRERIAVSGMDPLVGRMAEVVIRQRLHGLDDDEAPTHPASS
jgi:hypothetical protein